MGRNYHKVCRIAGCAALTVNQSQVCTSCLKAGLTASSQARPACVECGEPAHLFLRTNHPRCRSCNQTKNRDVSSSRAKLTMDQVAEIRRCLIAGETQKDVAIRFGVSPSTVLDIYHGRSWREVLV